MPSMLKRILFIGCVGLLLTTPALGEYYQYTDANGMQRFTDDLSTVPPDQRPNIKTYQSVKSEPVQPAPGTPVGVQGKKRSAPPSPGSATPGNGTWRERISHQANELDRIQVELNKTYQALDAERKALAAKEPPIGASAEERAAYRRQVNQLNAKIDDYEARYADFRKKEKAFNDQYVK